MTTEKPLSEMITEIGTNYPDSEKVIYLKDVAEAVERLKEAFDNPCHDHVIIDEIFGDLK